MDLKCPSQIPQVVESEIHQHPLTFRNKASQVIGCNICDRFIKYPFLCCIECNSFNIHVHCLPTLPPIVKHRDHRHPLSIVVSRTNDHAAHPRTCCDVCKQRIRVDYPAYRCGPCDFYAHAHCIFSEMENVEREMEISCHEHMLRLRLLDDVEKRGDDDDDVLCDGCNESFTRGGDWAYGCTQCGFYLHLWCAGLPQELQQHILHPQHPLTLVARAPYRPQTFHCKACRRTISRGFSYSCSDCGFDLDVKCAAFLVPSTGFSHPILHPSHQHPFLVCCTSTYYSMLNNAAIQCSRCGLPLEETEVYVCTECILLLHPSCAQLGQEIEENPFHPQHHLKLNQSADATLRLFKCNICGDRLDRFAYSCAADADSDSRCLFNMHLKCALQIPQVVASKIHQHPLFFRNMKPESQINCNICDQFIEYPFLWCMECKNFNIHVHCFPKLPHTSKYRYHVHVLSLAHSPIKDHPDEDESSEFYCDACEETRQLWDPCYYCKECPYVAHVHCVFHEILDSIGEKNPFVKAQNEEEKVLTELNEEIAILEAEIKAETTQLDALKTELKEIKDKHELFFKIAMSALKIA